MIRSTCINLVTSPFPPAGPHPLGAAAEARRPKSTSDPMTNMDERVDAVPCSAKRLHRKSRSAATSQPSMRTASNPFTFEILERTTLPVSTPSKGELASMEASGAIAERRCSFGTYFRSLNRGTGETSWRVDLARGADHRPVECWMAKSPGSGLFLPVRKEKQAQSQTSTTHRTAEP